MNESNYESNIDPEDRRADRELIEALRLLRPKSPRLDLSAIRATASNDTPRAAITPSEPSRSKRRTSAMAWWSGVATGAAIAFAVMNWLVIGELRTKIEQLERKIAIAQSQQYQHDEYAIEDRFGGSIDSDFDLNAILNSRNLAVGSHYARTQQWAYARTTLVAPSIEGALTNAGDMPATKDLSVEQSDPVVNRMQLLKQLKHDIF
jgi:hypothetical protein